MKNDFKNYELALAALEELSAELGLTETQEEKADRPKPALGEPSLSAVLEDFGELPRASLFLGAAYDGLPILLNLNDPTPGPILITGDKGAGKRRFLQMIAQASALTHSPSELQFGVITKELDEWASYEEMDNCMGVFPPYKDESESLILGLADWAHNNRREKRFALLLVDELETALALDDEAQQNLRWLLLRGPNRRVWTFSTLDSLHRAEIVPWANAFRTRLLGADANDGRGHASSRMSDAALHLLEPGVEFLLRENNKWVKFWLPEID